MTNKVIFAPVLHSLIQTASQQRITAYQDRFSQDQIKALIDTIRSALKKAAKEAPLADTATLASKILHGTFGCIPAFDRFFVKGIRATKKCSSFFQLNEAIVKKGKKELNFPTSIDGNLDVLQAWSFSSEISSQLVEFSKGLPIMFSRQKIEKEGEVEIKKMPYPTMRIVDQVFWSLGRHVENDEKKRFCDFARLILCAIRHPIFNLLREIRFLFWHPLHSVISVNRDLLMCRLFQVSVVVKETCFI